MEQARRPPLHQAVTVTAVGELFERRRVGVVPTRVVECGQRRLDPGETLAHLLGGGLVERGRGRRQTGEHPHDQAVEHGAQRGDVGVADIPVAQRGGERWQGIHEVGDVRIGGGPFGEAGHARTHGLTQLRQQRPIEDRHEVRQAGCGGRTFQ